MRSAAAFALSVVLAGCQPDGAPPDPERPQTRAIESPDSVKRAAEKPKAGTAILDAGGVALGRRAASATRFAFGTPRSEVDAAANRVLGQPGLRTSNGECGSGPMEFTDFGGLTLNYSDDRLVGWFAETDPALVTSDGIRPGIRIRDLEVTRSAAFVDESTLEGEFAYVAADGQTIGGFASGEGRDARVESLYAGINCFFR